MTRYFKIGSNKIAENDSTSGKSIEEVQQLLASTYPEVRNATIRTKTEGEHTVVEFLPKPGRKG